MSCGILPQPRDALQLAGSNQELPAHHPASLVGLLRAGGSHAPPSGPGRRGSSPAEGQRARLRARPSRAMNQPDRYERFVLPEHKKKLEYVADTKLENAGTYTVEREDHTLGNLVRMQLHRDPAVLFSGYRIPHPLEPRMLIKVQTTHTEDPAKGGSVKPPSDAFVDALNALAGEFAELRGQMEAEIRRVEEQNSSSMGGGMGGGGPGAGGRY